MTNMKYSGVKWIGNIPNNWIIKKIKYLKKDELNSFVDGDWIDSQYISEKGIRYYTTGNIGDGKFKEQGSGYITEETFKLLKCKYAYAGDLVFSRLNAPYGRSCILPNDNQKCVLAVDNVILRTMQEKRYICYVTQTNGYHKSAEDYSNGSTMQRLSRINLGNIFIPLPSLNEQKLIANFLDKKVNKLDEILNDLNKQIEILNCYKKLIITEKVTENKKYNIKVQNGKIKLIFQDEYKIFRIKDVLAGITDGTHGTFDRVNNGEYLFSAKNVFEKGLFIGDNESMVSNKDYNKIIKCGYPRKNDLLMCCVGTIGRTMIYKESKPYAFQRSVLFLRCNNKVIPEFLNYTMNSNYMLEQEKILINKSAQDGLYQGTVKNMLLYLPSLAKQKQIVVYLNKKCNQIDKIIENKQKQIQNIEEYKKSVIYEYVTGKKRVKGADKLYG